MTDSRLTLAVESGLFVVPAEGRIVVLRARVCDDLSALDAGRVHVVQGFRPDHDALMARGIAVDAEPSGPYAAAIVMLPRAKAEARALIAEALSLVPPGAWVVVDGQKTDGIDSVLRECRARVVVGDPLSKSHGKIFVLTAPASRPAPQDNPMADWRAVPRHLDGGFVTVAGLFSADGVDRGSALLAAALPARLKGRAADLGAGWGFLAAALLRQPTLCEVHLIEAEKAALDCARIAITDPRARFHWADATTFRPEARFDVIVTNPPFHTGRAAQPQLGAAFIGAAARMLNPGGQVWMVSNRHLPYEAPLKAAFRDVEEAGGDAAFKITRAARPHLAPKGPSAA